MELVVLRSWTAVSVAWSHRGVPWFAILVIGAGVGYLGGLFGKGGGDGDVGDPQERAAVDPLRRQRAEDGRGDADEDAPPDHLGVAQPLSLIHI